MKRFWGFQGRLFRGLKDSTDVASRSKGGQELTWLGIRRHLASGPLHLYSSWKLHTLHGVRAHAQPRANMTLT